MKSAGTDLVDTRRIESALQRHGDRFVRRILTEAEIRPGLDGSRLAAYLARQFAAKEAVSKVLGTGMRQGVHFTTIQVLRNPSGAPVVTLLGSAAEIAASRGIEQVIVSLSDERDYAIAFAVGI